MKTEYKALTKNEIWILVPKPENKQVLSNEFLSF